MKTVIAIMKIINIVNEKIAWLASFCLPLLILALIYEVVARYVFSAPTTWSGDATYFLCSIALDLYHGLYLAGQRTCQRGHDSGKVTGQGAGFFECIFYADHVLFVLVPDYLGDGARCYRILADSGEIHNRLFPPHLSLQDLDTDWHHHAGFPRVQCVHLGAVPAD